MVMQGETIEAKFVFDATQALQELAKFNQETTRSLTAVEKIDKRVNEYERDLHDLSAAIASGAGNTAAYTQQMRRLEAELDAVQGKSNKAAASLRAVSVGNVQAAGSTRNVGMAALEASRALEDLQYGVSGIVNNIPSLVMALGGGAGLTAAISLGAVAVNQLVKAFTEVEPAVKDAADKSSDRLDSLRGEIENLALELRGLEIGAPEAEFEAANAKYVESVEKAREATRAWGSDFERFRRQAPLGIAVVGTTEEMLTAAKEAVKEMDENYKKLTLMGDIYIKKAAEQEEKNTKNTKKNVKERVSDLQNEKEDSFRELISYHEKWNNIEADAAEKSHKELVKRLEAQREYSNLVEENFNKLGARGQAGGIGGTADRTGIDEFDKKAALSAQMANDWAFAWKVAGEEVATSMGGAVGAMGTTVKIATDGISQLTEDLITGQEHVAERLAVLVMQQAGQSLIANGIDLSGEAIKNGFKGLIPLAAVQAAGAAGLISSGVALGGVAAGIEHTMAGGIIGHALPDKSGRRDRGASPRAPRDGTSDGGYTVNIAYGVAGPMPEDTARELAKAMRTGGRRGV